MDLPSHKDFFMPSCKPLMLSVESSVLEWGLALFQQSCLLLHERAREKEGKGWCHNAAPVFVRSPLALGLPSWILGRQWMRTRPMPPIAKMVMADRIGGRDRYHKLLYCLSDNKRLHIEKTISMLQMSVTTTTIHLLWATCRRHSCSRLDS